MDAHRVSQSSTDPVGSDAVVVEAQASPAVGIVAMAEQTFP
ncbi:hypothetical protein [Methylobacterium sp. NMS14P]|nr:hypothetical protein [Methylobacterium sp. NMS14P]